MGVNVEILRAAYAALAERRFDRIGRYFDPSATYRSSGVFPGLKAVYAGHEEIEAMLRLSTEPWETLEVEVLRTRAEADLVVAEIRFHGRGAGSGIEVSLEAGHVARFHAGRIVELAAFASWEEAVAASGLSREPVLTR